VVYTVLYALALAAFAPTDTKLYNQIHPVFSLLAVVALALFIGLSFRFPMAVVNVYVKWRLRVVHLVAAVERACCNRQEGSASERSSGYDPGDDSPRSSAPKGGVGIQKEEGVGIQKEEGVSILNTSVVPHAEPEQVLAVSKQADTEQRSVAKAPAMGRVEVGGMSKTVV
jgi:hypothetical protein